MAKAIQGITLEIDGNSTKLVDALEKPKAKTKELQASLKDVNSALRFDTKNVDLLDQKQRLLTKTISSTEDELKLLKEAQKQYIASGKDVDSQEYVELEAKIAAAERSLERLKNQQENFSAKTRAMGISIGEFGAKTEDLGKKFMPITAGIAGVGAAATAAWSELDEAYDAIAAGTGATGDSLKDLQASFDNVYGDFPADSASVGTAIADLNTRFGFTGEQLENCSGQFLKFAQVNGTDVSSAIALVSRAMGDAGIESSEYASVLDALTSASQASGLSVDKLAESITKYGAPMRALGFEMEDSIALFAQWEKAGVNTEIAFSGMKKAISNWGKEGKNAKEEFQKTLKAIESAPTIADATSLAIEAFGSKAGPDLADAIKGGRFSVEEMTKAIEKSGGIVDQTFNDMLDPADSIAVSMNNLKIAGADLGSAIQSTLAPMLDKLAENCRKLAQWFKGLSDSEKEHIVQLGLLVAAIGPTLIGVGKMAAGVSSLIKYFSSMATVGGKLVGFFSNMGGGLNVLKAAFSALVSPIGLIVAAIAGLVGAFATLWNTNEKFRNNILSIWEEIQEKVGNFITRITDRLGDIGINFSDITTMIQDIWTGFCEFLAPIFEAAFQQVSNTVSYVLDTIYGVISTFVALMQLDWTGFWQGIQDTVDAAWGLVYDTVSNVITMITSLISEFLSWFGIEWTADLDAINQIWKDVWKEISDFIDSILAGIQELFAAFVALITGDWDGFCKHLNNAWQNVWNGIKDFGQTIWNGIKSIFKSVWDSIKSIFDNVTNSIYSSAQNIWNNIKNSLSNIWNGIRNTCQNVWNGIKSAIINPIQDAYNSVSNIFSNIKNSITSKINGAKDAVSSAISRIRSAFNFSWHLPHLSLPRINIVGKFSLTPPQVPHFSLSWYAKAMEGGMILNSPTIFGMDGNKFLAGGEAGPEAVVGVSSLSRMLKDGMDEAFQKNLFALAGTNGQAAAASSASIDYDRLADAVIKGLSGTTITHITEIDGRPFAKQITPLIDKELDMISRRK